ncbi:MAG: MATE family efflux transporter [Lachnospiraceae bacterium]|nr:MATE family efflux transporter [Lachnospiraceae bacterium]
MGKLEKNLTEGNVVSQLLRFAIPFILSNLIQSLYNVADMFIVGQFNGSVGISAVNSGGQVTFIATNIVVGLCAGATVIIAQHMGTKDKKAIRETISTLIISLLVVGVVLMGVMFLLSEQILHWINTPDGPFQGAKEYLDITIAGTLFIFGYNALSAIMRGMGDSKTPLIFVGVACVVNIGLDYLFVGYFGMGARGAALATVMAQAISVILCIIYLKKNDFAFDFKLSSFHFYKDRLRVLLHIGIPTSVQNVITNFSFLVLTALVNSYGTSASAALGVVGKFNGFAILPAIAMSSSISAMVAQNVGAGMFDRAKHTMRVGTLIGFGMSFVIFIFAQAFPGPILNFFNNEDPEMITYGIEYMRSFSFDYIFAPLFFGFVGLITGAGHTKFSLVSNMLSALVLRIPIALLFGSVLGLGLFGIGLGGPFASFGSLILAVWYYKSGRWMGKTAINENRE